MAPLSQMSIGPTSFDAFLYSLVGEDEAGIELSVLSALARLGLDPWNEAARLANLPRAAAAQALAKSIAMLPVGNWREADSHEIAARLVNRLPAAGAPLAPAPAREAQSLLVQLAARLKLPSMLRSRIRPLVWVGVAVLAIGWFCFLNAYNTGPLFEPPQTSIEK